MVAPSLLRASPGVGIIGPLSNRVERFTQAHSLPMGWGEQLLGDRPAATRRSFARLRTSPRVRAWIAVTSSGTAGIGREGGRPPPWSL